MASRVEMLERLLRETTLERDALAREVSDLRGKLKKLEAGQGGCKHPVEQWKEVEGAKCMVCKDIVGFGRAK